MDFTFILFVFEYPNLGYLRAAFAFAFVIAFTFAPNSEAAGPKGPNLIDVAVAVNSSGPYAGQFDTLIAGVLAADPAVAATLGGNGQKTVFAPTDDAFAALGLDETNIGTALSQEALTEILLYHVANGRRDAADVTSSSQIRTLQRGFLQVSGATLIDSNGNPANIIVTDVPAANGIIHVIDAVVMP